MSGGPRLGPALPVQLALSDRLLLGRFLHGLAGVLRSLTGSGSGIASGGSSVASGGSGVASGGSGGVDSGVASGGGGIDSGFASGGSGVASGGGGINGGIRRLGGGIDSGFDRSFLLGAAGERKGGQGGGECDLRVHVQYPMGSVMDEKSVQQSPGIRP